MGLVKLIADYHLLIFAMLGFLDALALSAWLLFRLLGHGVDAYWSFRERCLVSRRRYEEAARAKTETGVETLSSPPLRP